MAKGSPIARHSMFASSGHSTPSTALRSGVAGLTLYAFPDEGIAQVFGKASTRVIMIIAIVARRAKIRGGAWRG